MQKVNKVCTKVNLYYFIQAWTPWQTSFMSVLQVCNGGVYSRKGRRSGAVSWLGAVTFKHILCLMYGI